MKACSGARSWSRDGSRMRLGRKSGNRPNPRPLPAREGVSEKRARDERLLLLGRAGRFLVEAQKRSVHVAPQRCWKHHRANRFAAILRFAQDDNGTTAALRDGKICFFSRTNPEPKPASPRFYKGNLRISPRSTAQKSAHFRANSPKIRANSGKFRANSKRLERILLGAEANELVNELARADHAWRASAASVAGV